MRAVTFNVAAHWYFLRAAPEIFTNSAQTSDDKSMMYGLGGPPPCDSGIIGI